MSGLVFIYEAWAEMFQHLGALLSSGAFACFLFLIAAVCSMIVIIMQKRNHYHQFEDYFENFVAIFMVGGVIVLAISCFKNCIF